MRWARGLLHNTSETAALDTEVLLCNVCGWNSAGLLLHENDSLSPESLSRFIELVEKRLTGVPIAYLTGTREFWSLDFSVNRHTLIPRPDTETLVSRILELVPANADWSILDLGCGSGNIAISIAKSRPDCRITAIDENAATLAVARTNAKRHQCTNITIGESNWFGRLENQQFDLIAGNPPYIASDDAHLEQGDLVHEPTTALVSGPEGLDDIRVITAAAPGFLRQNGWLLLEHGTDQRVSVAQFFTEAGFGNICCRTDFGGNDRITEGRILAEEAQSR